MSSPAQLRKDLESALALRFPAALSPRVQQSAELRPCGLPEVDRALGGGLPLGAISELSGAHSSGRTTLALATLAEVTRQGECCAYIDVSDALNPASAAALGVDLQRLLWIRAGQTLAAEALPSPEAAPAPELKRVHYSPGRHPRNEVIGLDRAVGTLFHSARAGREDYTPRCSEALRRQPLEPVSYTPVAALVPHICPPLADALVPHICPPLADVGAKPARAPQNKLRKSIWEHLDQALRAADLLLAAGGFRAIVLDLGDVPPKQARRVPLATWYRFRLQASQARTLFLLLTQLPCANSCAAVSLHCSQGGLEWQRAAARSPQLLTGAHYRVEIARSRTRDFLGKKPAGSVNIPWRGRASRVG
jgi:recombination protein RecA